MAPGGHLDEVEGRGVYTAITQIEEEDANPIARDKETASSNGDTADLGPPVHIGSVPTSEDLLFLPRIADDLPYGAFLIAIVELCERFAYYGLSGPFQNYISNKYRDENGLPGALGLKQTGATALTNLFQFWCYITPVFGAFVSDQYLGKYVTIKWFSMIYMAGIGILFVTSLPWSIERGAAFPGLILAMVVIGFGTGGIKSNVSPLIAEQVRCTEPFVCTLRDGKKVVVDPDITVQRIYMLFYMYVCETHLLHLRTLLM
jgi:dipeptide/tripeptide permease